MISREVFHIPAADGAALWVLLPLILMFLFFAALFASSMYYTRFSRVTIEEDIVRIHSGWYGRSVPAHELKWAEARILNLYKDREFELARRTNGVGLPGYQAGWFMLRNGEKVLAFVTDKRHVVYIPTEKHPLLISLEEPEQFLEWGMKLR